MKIVAVRVLNSDGWGTWSQGIAGLDYAISAGAKVINASSADRPARSSAARRSTEI